MRSEVHLYLLRSYNGGLLTTSKASTEQGRRIGHQVLIGFWLGLTSQMPSMATHEERRSPVGTLLKISVQWLPGAIFVAVWQYLFLGKLLSSPANIPGFDPKCLASTGGTESKLSVPKQSLAG